MESILLALQHSALGEWLNASRNVAIALQILHILFFTAVLAVVIVLTLAIFKVLFRDRPVEELAHGLRGYYRGTLAIALIAGFLQSLPRLAAYSNNSPFVAKQLFLVTAIVLQGWLHHRLVSVVPAGEVISSKRQLGVNESLAVLALLFWLLTAGAGRAIGFV